MKQAKGWRVAWRPMACAWLLAAAWPASSAPAWRLEVLDLLPLPASWPVQELSGLAWQPDTRSLWAVSDRGQLWRLPVTWPGPVGRERLQWGTLEAPSPLTEPAQRPRLNAEALAWRPKPAGVAGAAGSLLVADERQGQVWSLDGNGRLQAPVPLPDRLRAALASRSGKAGIESMAWHASHGLLLALQRPQGGRQNEAHAVHASDGATWVLAAAGPASDLKDMSLLDDATLLLLERLGKGGHYTSVLRPMSLAPGAPSRSGPVPAPVLRLAHPALSGQDNLEGLACVGQGLCLVVSDNAGQGRSVLILVRLHPPAP